MVAHQLERKVPERGSIGGGKPAGGPEAGGVALLRPDTHLRTAHHTGGVMSVPEMWALGLLLTKLRD